MIANEFALGYTYQDVLDADHEGETPGASRDGDVQLTIIRHTCQTINILPLGFFDCLRSPPETTIHTTIHTGHPSSNSTGLE